MNKTLPAVQQITAIAKTDQDFVEIARMIHCYGLEQLATYDSIEQIADTRLKAKALHEYITKSIKDRELRLEAGNNLAELRIRDEREIGRWLDATELNKGGGYTHGEPTGDTMSPVTLPRLENLGLHKKMSSRFQALYTTIPSDVFEDCVSEIKTEPIELTTAGLMRLAKKKLQESEQNETEQNILERLESLNQYRTIVIDPPWPIQKIIREERPLQDRFAYRTMTLEEITKIPIGKLAYQDGCHIYLWTTHKFLPASLELFKTWGVKYQCLMTWVKNVGITPFSWMYSTEHVLFGRVGNLALLRNGLRLDFSARVTEHSAKPDIFYERVIEASPEPRLEMFARKQRDGFEVWGDEV